MWHVQSNGVIRWLRKQVLMSLKTICDKVIWVNKYLERQIWSIVHTLTQWHKTLDGASNNSSQGFAMRTVCTRVVVAGVILWGNEPNKIQFTLVKLHWAKDRRKILKRGRRFTSFVTVLSNHNTSEDGRVATLFQSMPLKKCTNNTELH